MRSTLWGVTQKTNAKKNKKEHAKKKHPKKLKTNMALVFQQEAKRSLVGLAIFHRIRRNSFIEAVLPSWC